MSSMYIEFPSQRSISGWDGLPYMPLFVERMARSVGAGGDVWVLKLLETQPDGTELLGPDWSLIRVLEHAQDEDQHRENAANVGADGLE